MDVSRETEARFRPYCELLQKWTATINLVARSTSDTIFERHVADCLQVVPLVPPHATSAVDLGSGAGFPGLVVAAALHDQGRHINITLVESDTRKCSFLAEAARLLGVPVHIENKRILELAPLRSDVIMSRALAPLTELLVFHRHHGSAKSLGIYMKGERHAEECCQAVADGWPISVVAHPSETSKAAILLVSLGRAEV